MQDVERKRKWETIEEVMIEQLGHKTDMMSPMTSNAMDELLHDDPEAASPTKRKETKKQLFVDTEIASPVTSEEMNEADDGSEITPSEEELMWSNACLDPPSPLTPTDVYDDSDYICPDHDDDFKHMKPGDLNFLTVAENARWWFCGSLFKRVDKLPDYKQKDARVLFYFREKYGNLEYTSITKSFDADGRRGPEFDSLSEFHLESCLQNFRLEKLLIDVLTADRQFSFDLKNYNIESKADPVDVIHELRRHYPNMSYRSLWGGVVFRICFLEYQKRDHSHDKEKCQVFECDYDEVVRKLYDGLLDMFKTDEYFPDYQLLRVAAQNDWRMWLLEVMRIPHPECF